MDKREFADKYSSISTFADLYCYRNKSKPTKESQEEQKYDYSYKKNEDFKWGK